MKNLLFYTILLGLFWAGCKKGEEAAPKVQIDNRDFKVGTYLVTTDSGTYYMWVEKLDSTDYLGNPAAYTKVYNLLNTFPVVYGRVMDIYNPDLIDILQIGPRVNGKIQLPYYDVNGKSWWITSYTITRAGINYGRVSHDTLRLYVHLNNHNYYQGDTVAKEEKFVTIEGVRGP